METKMKKFVFLVALLALVLPGMVSAAEITNSLLVKVNGQDVGGNTLSVPVGSTIIVETVFIRANDESEVTVSAWIEGYKNDIEKETARFDVIQGVKYVKWLSLVLPSDMDATDEYRLVVRLANRDEEDQEDYTLTVQRDSYKLDILSVEYTKEVKAGENLAVDVVVKNRGAHEVEDVYISVAIPELGVVKKVYAGDIVSSDTDDDEDTVEKTIVLALPSNAKAGEYTVEVKVLNDGEEASWTDKVVVKGASSVEASSVEVVTAQLTKEVSIGGTQVYRIEIVNPTDETKVITIGTPASLEAQGVIVVATPSVVKIGPNSAQTVEVSVQTSNGTPVGEYNLPVKISEGTGADKVVAKEVGITANVVKSTTAKTGSKIAISTVILAIIFVVLLIVLFVSLGSKKEAAPATGSEETAYY